jgi:hypothetical protein
MAYKNYSISASKGQFYEKSKTKKEGYEEVTYGTEGKSTFHKYEKYVKGKITNVETKEIEHEGKKLQFFELTLKEGDTENKISTSLKNSKGNYNDEVKAMVSALEGAEKGVEYSANVFKKETEGKNGKTYNNLSFYLNLESSRDEDGKATQSTGYIPFAEIPAPIKDEDEDLGTTWDWKPVNKFYAQKIKALVEKFGSASKPSESKKEEPKKEEKPVTKKTTNPKKPTEEDDLPF